MFFSRRSLFRRLAVIVLSAGVSSTFSTVALAQDSALVFDGVDDLATIFEPAGWPSSSTTLTMEAWIKPTDISGSEIAGVVWGPGAPWGLSQRYADNSAMAFTVSLGPTASAYTPTGTLVEDVWVHIAGTWDGTTMKIFVNGAYAGSQEHPAPNPLNLFSDIILGRHPNAEGFAGTIDEVRVWDWVHGENYLRRYMYRKLRGTEPDLIGYWALDEETGQDILDHSVHSNHGVLGSTAASESTDPQWTADACPHLAFFFDDFESGDLTYWSASAG